MPIYDCGLQIFLSNNTHLKMVCVQSLYTTNNNQRKELNLHIEILVPDGRGCFLGINPLH
jgi:hypothetical protein